MAWKLILTNAHTNKELAVYALQARFVGDCVEIHTTDGRIELISLNEWKVSTWTRDELWDKLRQYGDGKLWFEGRAAS